jgi:hypothetical protein
MFFILTVASYFTIGFTLNDSFHIAHLVICNVELVSLSALTLISALTNAYLSVTSYFILNSLSGSSSHYRGVKAGART